MKTKHILSSLFLGSCLLCTTACVDKLDIGQHGVTNVDNFYETDADAEEAVIACYNEWKTTYQPAFWLKNLLSDDCYSGGESWDAASGYLLTTYRFDASFGNIGTLYQNLYNVIYDANMILENVAEDSDIKLRARAEAKVFRAMAYIELISLWGTPPLVDHVLSMGNYALPNGDKQALWNLVNTDLAEAIDSGHLTEKAGVNDWTYRITKQFAQALLGKAYIYQGNYGDAATVLDEVISSGKYDLYSDFENIQTTKGEANCESLFESNYVYDANQVDNMSDMIWVYTNWRGDRLSFDMAGAYASVYTNQGWGFFNPTKEAYDAFVAEEGENGYRLNASIKTYEQIKAMGVSLADGQVMPDNAGLFSWKYRSYNDDCIQLYFLRCPNNLRAMRYAEVLLFAAEAHIQGGGDAGKALESINKVRSRARLEPLPDVTMDDIKKERRLELWMEGCRYQDLVRWGDAAKVLADRGKERPQLDWVRDDAGNIVDPPTEVVNMAAQKNADAGFQAGKHELLPFPTAEINVNGSITQNPEYE